MTPSTLALALTAYAPVVTIAGGGGPTAKSASDTGTGNDGLDSLVKTTPGGYPQHLAALVYELYEREFRQREEKTKREKQPRPTETIPQVRALAVSDRSGTGVESIRISISQTESLLAGRSRRRILVADEAAGEDDNSVSIAAATTLADSLADEGGIGEETIQIARRDPVLVELLGPDFEDEF